MSDKGEKMTSEELTTTFKVTFDEEKIKNIISAIVTRETEYEINRAICLENGAIKTWIKEELYSHKDEIIKQVVERASREMVRKGMPKLLAKLDSEEEHDQTDEFIP